MKQILSIFFTFLMFSHLHSSNINWSTPPTILSGVSTNASDPQVAIDGNGDAIAVWVESNLVKSSSKPVSGNWSPEVSISATGASAPRLVSDINGNATAIWVENGVIKAATKTAIGNWSSSTTLSATGASCPTLCVDAAGDVIAAWVRSGSLETSTKLFGLNWQARVAINGTTAATPSIAVGGSGSNTRAVIVWQGVASGTNVIYSSTKLISGSWSTAQVISQTVHNGVLPSAAVDANGNAIAIWYAYDITGVSYTNVKVKSASRPSSTGIWSAVHNLSAPGIRNPSTLVARVAFDSIGNAIALWNISFDDETFNIESAVKPVNGAWSDPVDLVSSNLYAYAADLSVTSFGDVLSLYMFYNGNSLLIQSVESDINGFLNNFWSVPIIISAGSDNAFPKIAASLNGNVMHAAAVWVNYNGVNNSVVALTGSKTLVLPPSNLTVTQNVHNFGVFSEYYNTLNWHASTDPNVAGYVIFRNGLFIEQVGSDILFFIDDNRTLNGSVTYSVAAIDSQQSQSVAVSVSFP
jgi:hypothetical protein